MTVAGGLSSYAIFRIGECLVGVPIANLAEVCSISSLSGLMAGKGHILGGFKLRGGFLPLLDLGALAGGVSFADRVRKAAVIQHDDRQLAIAVDEVVSLCEVRPKEAFDGSAGSASSTQGLHSSGPNLFPRGFVIDGSVVNCLDAALLFESPDVLSVAKTERRKRTSTLRANGKHLVLRAGGATIAVDTRHIWATVPKRRLESLDLDIQEGVFLGFIEHIGWRIPVIDTNLVLGIGRVSKASETEVVVVRLSDDRLIGLHVDATDRLAAFADTDPQDSNRLIRGSRMLPRVVVTDDQDQVFMLDHDSLKNHRDVAALSEFTENMNMARQVTAEESASEHGIIKEKASYLVFEAGGAKAVPAEQVLRILREPKELVATTGLPAGLRGFFGVDSFSVPLIALVDDLGEGADKYVLLIAHQDERIGFLVERVRGIRISELRIPSSGERDSPFDLIQIREDGGKKLVPVTDLEAVAASIVNAPQERGDIPFAESDASALQ